MPEEVCWQRTLTLGSFSCLADRSNDVVALFLCNGSQPGKSVYALERFDMVGKNKVPDKGTSPRQRSKEKEESESKYLYVNREKGEGAESNA